MTNAELKQTAKKAGVPLWKLAEVVFGITDGQFSRKLRYELPETEKQKLVEAIEQLSKGA